MTPTQIDSYPALISALSARRRAMSLTLEELSENMGVADRYAAKLECFDRRLGPISMPSILGALQLQLVAEPDDDPEQQQDANQCPRPEP